MIPTTTDSENTPVEHESMGKEVFLPIILHTRGGLQLEKGLVSNSAIIEGWINIW